MWEAGGQARGPTGAPFDWDGSIALLHRPTADFARVQVVLCEYLPGTI